MRNFLYLYINFLSFLGSTAYLLITPIMTNRFCYKNCFKNLVAKLRLIRIFWSYPFVLILFMTKLIQNHLVFLCPYYNKKQEQNQGKRLRGKDFDNMDICLKFEIKKSFILLNIKKIILKT